MSLPQKQPAEFEGRLKKGMDWREIVAWVGDLPPMPQVAARAISMVEDPNTTAEDLNKLLSSDAALASRVLKIANSAMFSRQREITTLGQAIMVIGFKALKGIIVAATLRQLNKKFGKVEQLVWEHAMGTAMSATSIVKSLGKRYVEEIFLLGLLHNLGQIVMLSQKDLEDQIPVVMGLVKAKGLRVYEAEQEVLGYGHPLIGALVAKKWNFSPDTCQVILHYSDDIDAGSKASSELDEKIAVVHLADLIAHTAGVGSPDGYPDLSEEMKATARSLGVSPDNVDTWIQKLIEETRTRFENEASIYS
jgi:HD-like signal output (HDOD) protein